MNHQDLSDMREIIHAYFVEIEGFKPLTDEETLTVKQAAKGIMGERFHTGGKLYRWQRYKEDPESIVITNAYSIQWDELLDHIQKRSLALHINPPKLPGQNMKQVVLMSREGKPWVEVTGEHSVLMLVVEALVRYHRMMHIEKNAMRGEND